MTQYYYTPIPINSISDSLTAAFLGMEKDGGTFMRAANINSIIVTESNADQDQLEDLIYTLSLVHPNRCFVICIDEKLQDISAKFAARCHAVSKKEHICSEIVQLHTSSKNLSAVGNILRANLLIGKSTELVLLDPKVAKLAVESFSNICDQTIFSSALFADDFNFVDTINSIGGSGIDLEWVKLGIWRDQVKDIFSNPVWGSYLPSLKSIHIQSSGGNSRKGVPACSLLLAGWFIGQLGLRINNVHKQEILCSNHLYGQLPIKVENSSIAPSPNGEYGEIVKILMNFRSPLNEKSISAISIERNDELITHLSLGENFRLVRTFDDEAQSGLLKRYFLIGEATINYLRSLNNAQRVYNEL